MSLANVISGLKGRLESISGLRVYDYPPDSVHQLPAAIVTKVDGDYGQSLSPTDVLWSIRVAVLVQQWDTPAAMAELASYLAASGAKSVRAAVDGNLGGNADYARVLRTENVGRRQLFGGFYAAADFIVEAREAGL